MRILYLEPFYGGSHRAVADALVSHSSHSIALETLPPHNWKWRARASALVFLERVANWDSFDLVISGGLITVSDLRAAVRLPLVLYAHETQLTYPTPDGSGDLHLAFTDIANVAAASHTAFNSTSHRESFLSAAHTLLRKMPRPRPRLLARRLADRSSVCYPGIDERFLTGTTDSDTQRRYPMSPPLVVWNHRWEFDKNPDAFFNALRVVRDRGRAFRLALLGENFQVRPQAFERAKHEFADQIVAYGYAESRSEYAEWLRRGDIVVSTAIQENFGLAVMEAVAAGCLPLVPNRLSYPEIVPSGCHDRLLYQTDTDLPNALERTLGAVESGEPWIRRARAVLQTHAASFAWRHRIRQFDELFESIAARTTEY